MITQIKLNVCTDGASPIFGENIGVVSLPQ